MSAIDNGRSSLPGLTLEAVMGIQKLPAPTRPQFKQTLLDIIRDEDRHVPVVNHKDKKTWKVLRDRLWLKRSGPSTSPINANSIRFNSNSDSTQPETNGSRPRITRDNMTRLNSARFDSDSPTQAQTTHEPEGHRSRTFGELISELEDVGREGTRRLAVILAEERASLAREMVEARVEAEAAREQSEEPRSSLMELLEETDRQTASVGFRDDDGVDVDDRGNNHDDGDRVAHTCCVCMVRHKGAAFIPCGHTFCRLCSREIWIQRGNCPLCNEFISEILNIF